MSRIATRSAGARIPIAAAEDPAPEQLHRLRVPVLRARCEALGLATTGSKKELADRLRAAQAAAAPAPQPHPTMVGNEAFMASLTDDQRAMLAQAQAGPSSQEHDTAPMTATTRLMEASLTNANAAARFPAADALARQLQGTGPVQGTIDDVPDGVLRISGLA